MRKVMLILGITAILLGCQTARAQGDYQCPFCNMDMYNTWQSTYSQGRLIYLYRCSAGHECWFPIPRSPRNVEPQRTRISQAFQDFQQNYQAVIRLRQQQAELEQMRQQQEQENLLMQRTAYSDYSIEIQKLNTEREKAGLTPLQVMTFNEWLSGNDGSSPINSTKIDAPRRPNVLKCPYCKLQSTYTDSTQTDGSVLQYLYRCPAGHLSLWSTGW
jgi:phosphopantetheine adenylyltransferase